MGGWGMVIGMDMTVGMRVGVHRVGITGGGYRYSRMALSSPLPTPPAEHQDKQH